MVSPTTDTLFRCGVPGVPWSKDTVVAVKSPCVVPCILIVLDAGSHAPRSKVDSCSLLHDKRPRSGLPALAKEKLQLVRIEFHQILLWVAMDSMSAQGSYMLQDTIDGAEGWDPDLSR